MGIFTALRNYAALAFRWQKGRQGTGYDKMLLFTAPWPLPFDSYLIRYPDGSEIPPSMRPSHPVWPGGIVTVSEPAVEHPVQPSIRHISA